MSGQTSTRDFYMPLRDLALRLQSDALVLDQQARDLQRKASDIRREAEIVYATWQQVGNIKTEKPVTRGLCIECGNPARLCDCRQFDQETK